MGEREHYPAGVPCWIETLQPDPSTARDFYGPLFGWEFTGPAADGSFVGQIDGRDVAGIGSLPDGAAPPVASWLTSVRVDDVDAAVAAATLAGGNVLSGPHAIADAGRRAVVADRAGAPVGLWEPGARVGAQVVNEPRVWALSTLFSADPEGSQEFYCSVFGWQPEPFGRLTLWRVPGYFGGIASQPVSRDVVGIMAPPERAAPNARHQHWSVDFFVDDADKTVEAAVELGGTIAVPVQDNPGFRSAFLTDPQGATFSVTQLIDDSSPAA